MDKQIRNSYKSKNMITTSRPSQILHIDMFGPTKTASRLGGKCYAFVIINDFSKFTWLLVLANNDEVLTRFTKLWKKLQNEKMIHYN